MEPPIMLKPRLKSPGSIPYGGEFYLNLPELGMIGRGTTFSMPEEYTAEEEPELPYYENRPTHPDP